MNIVLAKLGMSLCLFIPIALVLSGKAALYRGLENRSLNAVLCGYWLVLRLFPYVLIYFIFNYSPTSDVNGFWDMAYKAADGQVVYRDFWSPYSPLYSYFLGAWTYLWHDPKIIVFAMLVMEGIAVRLSFDFYRNHLSKTDFLFRALLYFLMPGSLILCVIGAQEDIWIWLFVIAAVLTGRLTGSVVWCSFALAFGVLLTKAVFVLFLLPLFLLEKDKLRFTLPLLVTGVLSIAVLYRVSGLEFLQPVGEADTLRAPNILSILTPWTFNAIGTGEGFWNWVGLLLTLLVGGAVSLKFKNAGFTFALSVAFIAMFATLMIVQQSAYSNYIFLFLLPLVLIVMDWTDKKMIFFLCLYNLLCVVHPSYWWRLGMPRYLTPKAIISGPEYLADYVMQVLIVAGTVYLILFTLTAARHFPLTKALK